MCVIAPCPPGISHHVMPPLARALHQAPFMTEERVARIASVVSRRTYSVLPVVEVGPGLGLGRLSEGDGS